MDDREIGKDRLLRGQGRYVADLQVPGTLELAVVRSVHGHARVTAVDAGALDGDSVVRAVLTGEDLRRWAPRLAEGEPPALAQGEVRFVGQPVAAVCVEGDRYAAEDAAERIAVSYDPLPAVMDAQRGAGGTRARPDQPSDDAYAETFTYGDVDRAFAAAPVQVTFEQSIARATAHPLEARAILCVPDPLGHLTVYAAHQSAHGLKRDLCQALSLGDEQVRVVLPDVGGGFGIKNGLYPEDGLCALLALRLRRPVRFVEDRREHFQMGTQERESVQRVRIAADRDGRILAVDAEAVADHGAYAFRFPIVGHVATMAPVAYEVPAYRARVRSVYTHKTPQGPYRGAGRPQANFLMERAMDRLADAAGLDRVEVRRRNLRPAEAYPAELALVSEGHGPRTIHLDSADLPRLLDSALAAVDMPDLRRIQADERSGGRPYGVGVVLSLEDTGTPPYEGARTYLGVDGKVHVVAGTPSQGQGHETVFTDLVARATGLAPQDIQVDWTDTAVLTRGIGTWGSRTATTGAVAVHLAAQGLAQRLREAAALALEADPADIELGTGGAQVRGVPARRIALAALAQRNAFSVPRSGGAGGGSPELSETAYPPAPRMSYGSSVHVAAVRVDPDDFRVKVDRYWIAYDVGRRLSPAIVEGQLAGGLSHGLSGALLEEVLYDGSGQLLTQSFMDYLVPTASDMPRIVFTHRETPTPNTPLGAKGVGESGTIPAAAALCSAVEDALGIAVDRIPMRPDRLYEAVRLARSAQAPRG